MDAAPPFVLTKIAREHPFVYAGAMASLLFLLVVVAPYAGLPVGLSRVLVALIVALAFGVGFGAFLRSRARSWASDQAGKQGAEGATSEGDPRRLSRVRALTVIVMGLLVLSVLLAWWHPYG